ncbi:hypothetical protein LZ31DRAFT_244336 [Colletotrichum somersetense]|nr:hypothetical protein LZ31DRAFT_244336 [Colletotrichum somersetense]
MTWGFSSEGLLLPRIPGVGAGSRGFPSLQPTPELWNIISVKGLSFCLGRVFISPMVSRPDRNLCLTRLPVHPGPLKNASHLPPRPQIGRFHSLFYGEMSIIQLDSLHGATRLAYYDITHVVVLVAVVVVYPLPSSFLLLPHTERWGRMINSSTLGLVRYVAALLQGFLKTGLPVSSSSCQEHT